jgi:guanosine-3',5'-bis(diphosphate) 3'-pyrophosphohydrolase
MPEGENNLRPGVDFDVNRDEFVAESSETVRKALEIATEIHKLDTRKTTGEPYVNHCIAVTKILRQWGADDDMEVAGILHDAWEDHSDLISLEQIKGLFGERVAHLVDGVSKFKSPSGKDNDFETLRKVARETLIEPGVAMIKMADRFHNMHTMEGFKEDKKLEKARETLRVYVPMAESLGLWQVKNMLADVSFLYTDPERYKFVKEKIDNDPRLNSEFIRKTENEIRAKLTEEGIRNVKVEHQVGGYWELSEKQKKSGMSSDSKPKEFVDITDVVSFRVVLEDDQDKKECYATMGVIRGMYENLLQPQRSDDYLVKPATNGYSAWHDTFKFPEGNIEVAVTTNIREQFNNWGVASVSLEERKMSPETYQRKMIFTPKEEMVFTELSATGIDIAYKLNPRLGIRAVAILVNGVGMGLDTVIPNAALVEIITDQHKKRPDDSWKKKCNAETARWIDIQTKIADHEVEVESGEKLLVDKLLRDRGILNLTDLEEDLVDKLLQETGCWNGVNDLYYKVALGLDLSSLDRKLDEMKIMRGMYTTVLIDGKNSIGISKEVADIIMKYHADTKNKVEWVSGDRFTIRALLTVDYQGKKKIEEELKKRFPGCEVV